MKTFVITYLSFTTPEIFLSKLEERYNIPMNLQLDDTSKYNIKVRVINALKHWLQTRIDDLNQLVIERVKIFITKVKVDYNNFFAIQLEKELEKKGYVQ